MATAKVTTFWGAFVAVLLKCLAALGFATPARAAIPAEAVTPAPAERTERTVPAGHRVSIPAQRRFEPVYERSGRSLPPTMKQRIRAEAHGASPTARSATGDGLVTDAPPAPDRALADAATG
ncbi:DUF6344 domain-containing protein [Streptomyces sp. NPDC051976]|uniref:DUF6344 domain-containing protein n=1 Tax=Streptomyces sp. NPDC051976 TaxID=3154947 RepID=UPI00342CDC37